jgi:tRNA A-37 threonylcarbamoyl transferase component Bud32/DNA-binding NarL/FixJ family response regulator
LRLLLLEDDPTVGTLIRHHLSCRWSDAEVRVHPPHTAGALPKEFLAQGYDAVLLSAHPEPGSGLEELKDLSSRPGFAPVLYLLDREDQELRERALVAGACGVIVKRRIGHEQLVELLETAARAHRRALADWRISPAALESRRFGEAHIPGYRRARLLARGSVSHLYLAESEKAGSLVVLKVTPSRRDEGGVDQAFARFLQEYEIAQRVQHPNIVRLHELGVADDHAYLSMEYFPCGDLRRRMREGLGPTAALGYAAQMARALAALHEADILHRDLKPGNVMLRADDQVALIDFGMAKQAALAFEITDAGLIFGTPHYMSPEQGHGQPLDARSDLYSLGVVLYELLTGQKPYNAENPMAIIYLHRHASIPRLPAALVELQPLLDQLLGKEPQERFASAAVALAALESMRAQWRLRGELA